MYLGHTFGLDIRSAKSFTFWLKHVLRPNFRSANWFSES